MPSPDYNVHVSPKRCYTIFDIWRKISENNAQFEPSQLCDEAGFIE